VIFVCLLFWSRIVCVSYVKLDVRESIPVIERSKGLYCPISQDVPFILCMLVIDFSGSVLSYNYYLLVTLSLVSEAVHFMSRCKEHGWIAILSIMYCGFRSGLRNKRSYDAQHGFFRNA